MLKAENALKALTGSNALQLCKEKILIGNEKKIHKVTLLL